MNYESDRSEQEKLHGKFNRKWVASRIFPLSLRRQKVLHTNRRRPNANGIQSPKTKRRAKNYYHPFATQKKKKRNT